MLDVLKAWYQRYFSDPAAVILLLTLIFGTLALVTVGKTFAPVIASLIIAYVLDWIAQQLQRIHFPRRLAVWLVFLLFMALLVFTIIGLLPLLWQQMSALVEELPKMLSQGQQLLSELPQRYPAVFSSLQMDAWVTDFKVEASRIGRIIVSASLASLPGLVALLVYIVLVPLMVYFFMMDKPRMAKWADQFMPKNRRLVSQVWQEVDGQIGNYIRGKVLEIIIVWIASYALFAFMGLNYALLLSMLVGFSVLIPYIGATVVTIPVCLVAFLQWGWTSEFIYLTVGYFILQLLDGNVLVPVLFSEAVSLHPIAIIVAILFFGSVWGFWGIFFAIPLATVVKAVIRAWFLTESQHA